MYVETNVSKWIILLAYNEKKSFIWALCFINKVEWLYFYIEEQKMFLKKAWNRCMQGYKVFISMHCYGIKFLIWETVLVKDVASCLQSLQQILKGTSKQIIWSCGFQCPPTLLVLLVQLPTKKFEYVLYRLSLFASSDVYYKIRNKGVIWIWKKIQKGLQIVTKFIRDAWFIQALWMKIFNICKTYSFNTN